MGLFGPLISITTLDLMSAELPAVTLKFKRDDRYIVMGIDLGVIGAADFNNVKGFTSAAPPAGQGSPAVTPKF